MDPYIDRALNNAQPQDGGKMARGAALGGLAGSPPTPAYRGGYVNFTKSDGVGQLTISRSLSEEGAALVERALREIIQGEAERLQTQKAREFERIRGDLLRNANSSKISEV